MCGLCKEDRKEVFALVGGGPTQAVDEARRDHGRGELLEVGSGDRVAGFKESRRVAQREVQFAEGLNNRLSLDQTG